MLNYGHTTMLDLVKQTCDYVADDEEEAEEHPRNEVLRHAFPEVDVSRIEGEFEQDPDEQAKFGQADQEYGGEYRFVNLGPAEVRRRLADQATATADRSDLQTAEAYWTRAGGYSDGATQAGEPYRGEEREAHLASSVLDAALAGLDSREDGVFVRGAMSVGGGGCRMGSGEEGGSWGIVDFDFLLGGAPLHEAYDSIDERVLEALL